MDLPHTSPVTRIKKKKKKTKKKKRALEKRLSTLRKRRTRAATETAAAAANHMQWQPQRMSPFLTSMAQQVLVLILRFGAPCRALSTPTMMMSAVQISKPLE
jgi:hypothetical protein